MRNTPAQFVIGEFGSHVTQLDPSLKIFKHGRMKYLVCPSNPTKRRF